MLTLNLIPKKLKKEIKLKRIYQLLRKTSGILIIITIVVTITILVAKIILQNNFNKIVEQTTLITKNSQSYNIKTRNINTQINQISQIQNDYITWSILIENLAKITPGGITLYSVKIDKEQLSIKINGKASLRDDLLAFKQNMEKSLIYSEVKFPLQNILQKENINFEIIAKLNLNKL